MFQAVFLLLLCTKVFAQFPGFGNCPNVRGVQDFHLKEYLGDWFELEKYLAFPGLAGDCVIARYKLNSNGLLEVLHMQRSSNTKHLVNHKGELTFAVNRKEGKFFVDYPQIKHSEHYILDTDYFNYAIILSCTDTTVINAKNYWIYSRHRNLPAPVLKKVYGVLDKHNLRRDLLKKTNQKQCPSVTKEE